MKVKIGSLKEKQSNSNFFSGAAEACAAIKIVALFSSRARGELFLNILFLRFSFLNLLICYLNQFKKTSESSKVHFKLVDPEKKICEV